MQQNAENVRKSYDQVTDEYALRIYHELEHKPMDRELLDRFARETRGQGSVCELGCGPGHVARYLYERGVPVMGIDLSPRMIEVAQKLNPGIEFRVGDMSKLDIPDESWTAIVAFYSIIHFPRPQIISVLQEFRRALQPSGLLLLAFHKGQEVKHVEEWWGKQVCLDGVYFEREEMENNLRKAGFAIEEGFEREPYEEVEAQTRRVYIFARKSR